jgi:tetratricopeptide (TPR) repeat protein
MITTKSTTPAPARGPLITWVLAGLTLALVACGLGWFAWEISRQPASFDDAIALADAGKLDEAAARIRGYVSKHPDDSTANLLLAQILLKKPDPLPDTGERHPSVLAQDALDSLDRVRPTNAAMAATLHLCRGNALDRLARLDEAETAWLEALKADPRAPEAGWNLLRLYYLQGREVEARDLGLRLFEVEPDAHDRMLLLLELVRADARPPAPGSVMKLLEPVCREHPAYLHSALALGLAGVRAGRISQGIDELRRVVQNHPENATSWDGLLTGLDESGQIDAMEEELDRAPDGVAKAPRLLKHRAKVAQDRKRWKEAIDLYRRAQAAEPYNRVVEYRLSRALRHVAEMSEADRIEERLRSRDLAIQEVRPLYDQATSMPSLGTGPRLELCQKIAQVRERMQLPDEALAWHKLALEGDSNNAASLAAVSRLGSSAASGK